jgi:hypothetical protein
MTYWDPIKQTHKQTTTTKIPGIKGISVRKLQKQNFWRRIPRENVRKYNYSLVGVSVGCVFDLISQTSDPPRSSPAKFTFVRLPFMWHSEAQIIHKGFAFKCQCFEVYLAFPYPLLSPLWCMCSVVSDLPSMVLRLFQEPHWRVFDGLNHLYMYIYQKEVLDICLVR